MKQFASDNYAGICPSAWEAMQRANRDHARAYGDDEWTARAAAAIRELFEIDCDVFFVFNGTAGNALALASLCRSYHGIVCHDLAHIETDECGAPEFFTGGAKLLSCPGAAGKLSAAAIAERAGRRSDLHFPKAGVLSLTQATEAGTLYTPDELRELCETARNYGLKIHMDGARFANAVAALDCSPRALTVDCGVDVLCLGGTKNGMAVGDAVVFFDRQAALDFDRRCKQAGQLCSKMRFLAAPWVSMLGDGTWLENGRRANEAAALLERRLRGLPGVELIFERRVNTLFLRLADRVLEGLAERGWRFYVFAEAGGARFMCSWDTETADIDRFVNDLEGLLSGSEDD